MSHVAAVSVGCLLLVWLGYPAIVALLAAARPRRAAPQRSRPVRVSVIIATRDAAATVRARVIDVLAADYPAEDIEVIVARDSAAAPLPPGFGRSIGPNVEVIESAGVGKATALNAGVRAATGTVLVFADAAQRFAPDAIRHLVRALRADQRLGAVSGALELVRADGGRRSPVEWYWALERRLRRDEARVHSTIGVTGAIYAMPRALWSPLPAGLILDDVYVPMRLVLAGYRVGFCESAHAFDARRTGASDEYRRKMRTLTGVLQLCAWLPAVLVPVRNPVWVQFVAHKLLRLLTPYWVLAVALWGTLEIGRAVWRQPAAAVAGLLVIAIVQVATGGRPFALARRTLAWLVALQAAPVAAALRGARGRWNVWPS